jgi:hypothetical protein
VIESVLPLHECADPAAAESAIEPLHSVADSAATESVAEPLQSIADSTATGVAPTETSWLYNLII